MNLTIKKGGVLYLNPLSLEFWELFPDSVKSIALDIDLKWFAYNDISYIDDDIWEGEVCIVLSLNILHHGNWKNSLYIRPELATKDTLKTINCIVYDNGWIEEPLFKLQEYYTYDKIIIATEQMKRQYLGGK